VTPSRRHHNRDYDTPNERRLKDTPSRSAWEEDENYQRRGNKSGRSEWDATPKNRRDQDNSQRSRYDSSSRSDRYAETPLPTPVHKHNKWAGKRAGDNTPWNKEDDEEEQKVRGLLRQVKDVY